MEQATVRCVRCLKMVEAVDDGLSCGRRISKHQGAEYDAHALTVGFQVPVQVLHVVDASAQDVARVGVIVDGDKQGVMGGHGWVQLQFQDIVLCSRKY